MIEADESGPSLGWYLKGWRASFCFGALVLCLSFVGFGAYVRDAQLSILHLMILSTVVWALPSCLVFVTALAGGATLPVAALAVALTAVRLLPMTVVMMPMLRFERARGIWFYIAAHFVAVTAYVEGLIQLPAIPAARRLSFFLGLGTGLLVSASLAGLLGYLAAGALPRPLAVGLLFLTPLYFLLSMIATANSLPDRVALVLGFVIGPIAHLVDPQFDLLWAGVIGGTLAYLTRRWPGRGRRA